MSLCEIGSMDKASPTNYNLVFPKIPTESTLSASRSFLLNVYSAILPGVSISEIEENWQGSKAKYASSPMTFDTWTVSYNVDKNFTNWKMLFDWMKYINNNKDKFMEERNNYTVTPSLVITDNFQSEILNVNFYGTWPSSLSEVSLSKREGEVYIESTVTFNYDYFEVIEI